MTEAHRHPAPVFAGVTYHSLRDARVIVTGGADGIGADIVRAFATQGSQVGFLDVDVAAGTALAAATPNTQSEVCGVRDVAAQQQRLGGVDVLVNNVANDQRHAIDEVPPDYFDERIARNLRPHYFATQAVLAHDLGPDDIRVNCVVPGWVFTERQLALWVEAAGEQALDANHCIPGRIVGADIAHMVLFLTTDTSRMITAQEFVVDGGWT